MSDISTKWSQSSDATRSKDKSQQVSFQSSFRFLSYFSFIQARWGEFCKPHICSLIDMMKQTDIVKETIDSGILIGFRRWLERSFMISRHHPYTKTVFKSLTEIRNEEVRHVLRFQGIIHPFSMFCLYYEFLMALLTVVYLIYVLPSDMAYLSFYPHLKWIKFVFDVIMTVSVIVNFSIGYWDKDNMNIVLQSKAIARQLAVRSSNGPMAKHPLLLYRRYIRTFLAWDVMSCIPSYTIGIYFFSHSSSWGLIEWLSLARMARILTIDRTLDMFRAYCRVPVELYVSIEILLWSYSIVLCCMALMAFTSQYPYLFDHITENKDTALAHEAIFATIRSLFGVGQVKIVYSYAEVLTAMLITMISQVVRFVAKVPHSLRGGARSLPAARRIPQVQGTSAQHSRGHLLLLRVSVPKALLRRVGHFKHVDRKSTEGNHPDNNAQALLDALSGFQEIPSYRLDKKIEKIKFIRQLPNPMIMQILSNMDPCYYCPGDVIFRVNAPARCLYFIRSGTVALHDENNIEVCHLEDSSYYGDISVILNQFHYVTMTAVAPCKIFKLSHFALMQILDTVPEVKERVFEVTRKLLINGRNDWVSNWVRTRSGALGNVGSSMRINPPLSYA
uniref:Cyclic nucleotide-binding domain-containing protein n=1 Tax=Dendroctonus ponderosae TaxID=77166 RepID=A0AAR5QG59_DENPD